jgi:hypothetical protein
MHGRVELALVADHAGDDLAEIGGVGLAVLLAIKLGAEAEGLELGEHVAEQRAGDVELVERLHGSKPRRPPLVRRAGRAAI